MIADRDEYTPTPAISHAILTYNRGRQTGLADGIVITPSHNPPQMIDRITTKLARKLYEVPVGFKWFVDGLLDGSLGHGHTRC